MNDYERVAGIIRYLDEHHTEQPDLARLAEHSGLSSFHFHRLFSRWAGLTPKDFLQCLTLSHAKTLLVQGESVLDAALNTGLSGPSRLHELCVTLEAASPGEWKSGGQGWTILAGFADSPFGRCVIGISPRGLCHLSFQDAQSEDSALSEIQDEWPQAELRRDDPAARKMVSQIFQPPGQRPGTAAFRAFVRGTEFQVAVWRALLQIRPGALVSYGRLAAALGIPTASRAVGAAVGQNPISYLIPCHRVIRETGALGGYRWGTIRKRAMQAWESQPGRQI